MWYDVLHGTMAIHKCETCNKTFERKDYLDKHKNKKKPCSPHDHLKLTFQCLCSKKFSHSSTLSAHKRVCKGEDADLTKTREDLVNELKKLRQNLRKYKSGESHDDMQNELAEMTTKLTTAEAELHSLQERIRNDDDDDDENLEEDIKDPDWILPDIVFAPKTIGDVDPDNPQIYLTRPGPLLKPFVDVVGFPLRKTTIVSIS